MQFSNVEKFSDPPTADARFNFRKEFDQAFQIYKKLNKNLFLVKNVISTESSLIYYEDIYDIYFSVYEGVFLSMLRTGVQKSLSYQFFGTIAENLVAIIDIIQVVFFVVLNITTPLTILDGYEGLCVLLLFSILIQTYFSLALRQIKKLILPIALEITAFALLIARSLKTSNYINSADLIETNYLCVDVTALGNFYSFETCDEHDKVYVWIIFLFISIANVLNLLFYIKFIRPYLPELTKHNFYLYVMRQLREHRVCLTIVSIYRNPASRRDYSPWWSSDISESLSYTKIWVTTPILNTILDDVLQGTETGQIQLKNFKIGRESAVIVEYIKELLKAKDRSLLGH